MGAAYPFDNTAPQAGERFAGLAGLYDHVTFRHLEALGIQAGWRCLEVGAGGGSVARFMSEQVGTTGSVLATDIDPRWLTDLQANVDVRVHDIGTDTLPGSEFDVVHARAVLCFVAHRDAAVARMVAALKPGGWLLLEELVPLTTGALHPIDDGDAELLRAARAATFELMRRRGADPTLARILPRVLRDAGLTDLGGEGFFVPVRSAATVRLASAHFMQVRDELVEEGLLSSEELDRCFAVLERSDLLPSSLPMISVWGRRAALPNDRS